MDAEAEDRWARGAVGVGTGAWVVLASAAGYVLLDWGPACSISSDEWEALSAGASFVCQSGEFPFTPLFLTFLVTSFVALAGLILRWHPDRGLQWRLCGGVALLPVAAFVALRVVTLIP